MGSRVSGWPTPSWNLGAAGPSASAVEAGLPFRRLLCTRAGRLLLQDHASLDLRCRVRDPFLGRTRPEPSRVYHPTVSHALALSGQLLRRYPCFH